MTVIESLPMLKYFFVNSFAWMTGYTSLLRENFKPEETISTSLKEQEHTGPRDPLFVFYDPLVEKCHYLFGESTAHKWFCCQIRGQGAFIEVFSSI